MKTILITGGTRGLGKVIANQYLLEGQKIIICSKSEKSCSNFYNEFKKFNRLFTIHNIDINNHIDIKNMVDKITSKSKTIDILINNAGIYGPIGSFLDNDFNEWKNAINTNLIAAANITHTVLPIMLKNNFGRVFNIAGGGASKGFPYYSSYATSKTALVRFTETIAHEIKNSNITVNAISPGFLATDIHNETISAGRDKAGEFFIETQKNLKNGGQDPLKTFNFIKKLSEPDCKINGRFMSSIFDDLEKEMDDELYTLRRIDNFFFNVNGNKNE